MKKAAGSFSDFANYGILGSKVVQKARSGAASTFQKAVGGMAPKPPSLPMGGYIKTPGGIMHTAQDVMLVSFLDEMEKIAWRGTYYHGSSPEAEEKILRSGLQTRFGSTGATSAYQTPNALTAALKKDFEKNTKGRVTMSRSKTVARSFGLMMNKDLMKKIQTSVEGKKPLPAVLNAWKTLLEYQPLEIAGKGLDLRRDPNMFLLSVQSSKDIPAALIRRSSERGGVRGLLRRVLARAVKQG